LARSRGEAINLPALLPLSQPLALPPPFQSCLVHLGFGAGSWRSGRRR
jgi:hypothetical protein